MLSLIAFKMVMSESGLLMIEAFFRKGDKILSVNSTSNSAKP